MLAGEARALPGALATPKGPSPSSWKGRGMVESMIIMGVAWKRGLYWRGLGDQAEEHISIGQPGGGRGFIAYCLLRLALSGRL